MTVKESIEALMQNKDALSYPVWEWAFVDPTTVPFEAEVREACEKNYCGCYGTCWCCPPAVGEWETLRDHFCAYQNLFVFSTRHELEDSFDFEGMTVGRECHEALARTMRSYIAEKSDAPLVLEILGAGGCHLCSTCTYPSAPCRHPELAFRAMEACGINVVTLSASCGMHYINGENTVTYFSAVFWN